MKKATKWMLLMLVLCLSLCLLAGCNEEAEQTQEQVRLYWNVEKFLYASSNSTRMPREDGFYYLRMATGGEQVDVAVADLLTVNFMDTLEIMGLKLDENGTVTEVLRVEELGYTIAVEDYYVDTFTETEMTVNSLGSLGGLSRSFSIANAEIFGVDSDGGLLCGLPGVLQQRSKVTVLQNSNGEITHVYSEDPFRIRDIYWNTARKFNSTAKISSRETDASGRFVFTFALNGEQVELYTRDQKIADSIDSIAAKCMSLTFDEEGYIDGVISAKKATGNSSFGSWYHVTNIQGDMVSAHKYSSGSDHGTSVRGQLAPDCKVYDCSGSGAYIGEPTELRLNDQIHGLKNPYGQVIIIFVVNRAVDADIYYNVSRQWDSATKATERLPNGDGWYFLKLAHDGQQATLKTRDKALVDMIDKQAVKCFGLDVEGDVIKAVYTASNVWGGKQFCSYDLVTDITDGVVTAQEQDKAKQPATYTGTLTENTKVYDVTGDTTYVGAETTLAVGDKIHALKDLEGNLTYVFVVSRPTYAKIYWNVSRQWDSATKQTKRTPNAEGFYEIVLAYNGQQLTFKTKEKALVNQMDSIATKCFGLFTDGDLITRVLATSKVYGGAQFCSWDIVTAVEGNYITAKEADASKGNKTYTDRMSSNVMILDVSGTGSFVGEESDVRVGDKIHALQRSGGGITYIYIIERTYNTPVYWNVDKYSVSNGVSQRPVGADGWWYITLAVDGQQQIFKTRDQNIVNAIDSIAVMCFGMETDGDVITRVIRHTNLEKGTQFCSWDTVTDITGGVITAEERDKEPATYVGKMAADCGVYDVSGESAFEGAATELRVGDVIHAMKDKHGNVTYVYVISRVKQIKTEEAPCEVCGRTVTWYSWDGVAEMEQEHYFLDESITVSDTAYIGASGDNTKTVCLDLRGKTVTGSVRVFRVYGTLNIVDRSEAGGRITSNAGGQVAVAYVYKNAALNIYGGTYTGVSGSANGGGTFGVDNGTLNIFGGVITGGQSAGNGGNIAIFNSGVVNLYSGEISNGIAAGNGGNISMGARSALNIYGGSIIGGSAKAGNCVHAAGMVKLYGGEQINISQIRLSSGKSMDIVGLLAGGSSVGVLLADGAGVVATADDPENLEYIVPSDESLSKVYDAGKILLQAKPEEHTHCLCGGTNPADHSCSALTFENWSGVALTSGTYNYCLADDLYLDGMLEIPSGVTLNLCLNGHNIEGADRVFQISGTLNLSDCKAAGTVTSTKIRQAPVFYVRDGGGFNMYGGTLKGTKKVSSDGGLGVVGLNADGGAVMNMYGGTVTGGSTSKNGGNIYLYHDSELNIYGGAIKNGSAESGGNICIGNAEAAVNLRGGSIDNGTATGAGGNIRISSGTFNVYTGSVLGGTTTNGNGGSVFITGSSSAMNMYGGTVSGGYAGSGANARSGGNIYVASNARLKLQDDASISGVPTVSGGMTQANNGGNIYYGGKSLVIDGASVTGGTAPGKGDDIYIAASGAVFTGNVTCADVYIKSGITVDVTALDATADIKFTYE